MTIHVPHLNHINPDLVPPPAPTYITNPPPETTCTCRNHEPVGQNPTCPDHPWWIRDTIVLHTATLTEQGTPAWEAAAKTYGGQQ